MTATKLSDQPLIGPSYDHLQFNIDQWLREQGKKNLERTRVLLGVQGALAAAADDVEAGKLFQPNPDNFKRSRPNGRTFPTSQSRINRETQKWNRGNARLLRTMGRGVLAVEGTLTAIEMYDHYTHGEYQQFFNSAGEFAGGVGGAILGGAIATLIPIPGATIVGAAIGAQIGSWAGGKIADFGYDLFTKEW